MEQKQEKGVLLRELSIGGVFISPMLLFALVSLVISALLRTMMHKAGLTRWVWQEAWFDVSLFVIVLAVVTYLSSHVL
ncbi:DUF1656 domain-containing protein [Kushneria phyllosphaerae]|uniref:Protein AaeX n=1 Tax=Kushneria phyllosphaerae TaxID=2100822 RepID=A0A2R8CNH5_9GAMM|nr:DUF1656 domain-containing protein [Kushneria phyllosphaerae]SPJ34445.1 Protein AaeX [Kushneria phyllosphaerae]